VAVRVFTRCKNDINTVKEISIDKFLGVSTTGRWSESPKLMSHGYRIKEPVDVL